jgi:hypothetical protein
MTDSAMETILAECDAEEVVGFDTEENDEETIIIISSDNAKIEFNKKTMVRLSSTIRNLAEGDHGTKIILDLHGVLKSIEISKFVLEKLLAWSLFYKKSLPTIIKTPIMCKIDDFSSSFGCVKERKFIKVFEIDLSIKVAAN